MTSVFGTEIIIFNFDRYITGNFIINITVSCILN